MSQSGGKQFLQLKKDSTSTWPRKWNANVSRIELSADSFASLRFASPTIRLGFPIVVPVL